MKRTYISLLLLFAATAQIFSQEAQNTKNSADQMLRSNGSVNPSTLGLEMSIPLGGYQGRGITLPIGLNYTSKLWRFENRAIWVTPYTEPGSGEDPIFGHTWTYVWPKYAEDSASGWTSSISQPYVEYTGLSTWFNCIGTPYTYYYSSTPKACSPNDPGSYIKRVTIRLPDGSHELRNGDEPIAGNPIYADWNGVYRSVDGSGVKYIQDNTVNPPVYRIYMPDGSFYDLSTSTELSNSQEFPATIRRATRLTDVNGNYVTFNAPDTNYPNGSLTDTLGRTFPVVVPREAPTVPDSPGYLDQEFALPGINPNTPYKFRWERLANAFTPNQGHATKYRGHTNLNFAQPANYSPSLFVAQDLMSECTYDALRILGRPDAGAAAQHFNPAVLTEVTLPNGAKYEFTYNPHGEVETIRYPSGGHEEYTYGTVSSLAQMAKPFQESNRGVVVREVYENDNATPSTWGYEADSADWQYRTTVTAPDGTKVERYMHRGVPPLHCEEHDPGEFPNNEYGLWWGYDNALAGRPFDERTFDSSGDLVQRTLTGWAYGDSTAYMTASPARLAQLNPHVVWTETRTYDGTAGVSAATKLEYHGDPDASGWPMNVHFKKEYPYTVVSDNISPGSELTNDPVTLTDPTTGTPVRKTETTFKTDTPYLDRNFLRLPVEVKVMDGQSNVKAKTQTAYDESTPLADGSGYTIPGWSDPQTNVRGLATSTKNWFNVNNANDYVQTVVQYNRFGNPRKTWDGNNNLSQVEYTDKFSDLIDRHTYALPTKTISAVPGGNGSNSVFETETTYEFATNLPVSTKDINEQITTMEYADPLRRPTKVIAPNGQQTITEYGAPVNGHYPPSERYVKEKEQFETARWTEETTYFDGLERNIKTVTKDADGDVYTETLYDLMGREWKTSSPYRQGDTVKWNEKLYDILGRLKTSITPDGAQLQSSFGVATSGSHLGTTITVTDQAGQKRRSVTNAFGLLVRVDEPNENGELGQPDTPNQATSYTYDLLDNLVQAVQGMQTRTFNYDALDRLTSVSNPESGTVTFTYDGNNNLLTKTDARSITVTNTYDRINRPVSKDYSDTTPDVTYFYDDQSVSNSKGKLTKLVSNTSEERYANFDSVGNVLESQQITVGQTYSFLYAYDLASNLTSQTYPSGRVMNFDYNSDGDLEKVYGHARPNSISWTYALNFVYTPHGKLQSLRLGNGRFETTQYNSTLQPIQIGLGHSTTDTGLWKLTYDYGTTNNNGNVRSQTITVPSTLQTQGFTATQTYVYDALNRLKQADEKPLNFTQSDCDQSPTKCWKQTFVYDRYGNRQFDANQTTIPSPIGTVPKIVNPAINSQNNQFVIDQDNDNDPDYLYDPSGNLIQDAEGRQFSYNSENKQTEVSNSNNEVVVSYEYDGDGNRVKKSVPGTGETTIFVYDADGDLAAEFTINVTPPDDPKTNFLTADALGSPRAVSDLYGDVVGRRDFLPFGEEINVGLGNRSSGQKYESDGLTQKFTSKKRDTETGFDYFEARYYASKWGRFTTSDEFVGGPEELIEFDGMLGHNPTFYAEPAEPQSLNKYQYGLNNPLRYIDPDGHQSRTADRVVPLPPWMWVTPEQAKAIGDFIEGNISRTLDGAKNLMQQAGKAIQESGGAGEAMGVVPGTSAFPERYLQNQNAQNNNDSPTGNNTSTGNTSRGSRNPNTARAAKQGREQHKKFADKVKKKEGWKSEKNVKDPKTGKTIRPDAQSRRGNPVELKPDTPSGRRRGAKQRKEQEKATGKKGRVVYYKPKPNKPE